MDKASATVDHYAVLIMRTIRDINWKDINWKSIFLSSAPFLCYLIIFKNYQIIRSVTGLESYSPPNVDILERLELVCRGI